MTSTRDHAVIRAWAEEHQATPATGEATPSGPATVDVNDGGAGVRFNFPGSGRYRPIEWDEWFANFDANGLTFLYEQAAEGGPPRPTGADPRVPPVGMGTPSARVPRYRLMKDEDLLR